MGFLDKMMFIFGLILIGVIAFVLMAGVIVALFQYFIERQGEAVSLHSGEENAIAFAG